MAILTPTTDPSAIPTREFGSKPIPQHVEMQREKVVPPKTNEVQAESQRHRLPQVNGWRVLIVPHAQPRTTKGGIELPNQTVDTHSKAAVIGYVVDMGPLAYKDEEKFGVDPEPWCKIGDYVLFGRYAGSRLTMNLDDDPNGLPFRILNDDEIFGTVSDPSDYMGLI